MAEFELGHYQGMRPGNAGEPPPLARRGADGAKREPWAGAARRLRSLAAGCDRWTWGALAVLLGGIVVRVVLAYPSHKYVNDGDCVMSGLVAFKVLRGEHPVFFNGVRIGSLGAHLTALLFLVFGPTRGALAAASVIVSSLTLIAWYLFLRELLGKSLALIGLPFAALLSPAVGFWTYEPNGYPETLLLCATTLWLAARIARGDETLRTAFGFGLSAGLAWWQSLQTLGCTLPALLWLGWRRPGFWRRHAWVPVAAAGFVLGALPWIGFNVYHPLASFRSNFAARPAAGLKAVLDNAGYLVTYDLRELVASTAEMPTPNVVQRLLRLPVITIHLAAALFFFASQAGPAWAARRPRQGPSAPPLAAAWVLFVLVTAAVAGLDVVSEVGMGRGLTVRYVLPLCLLVPGILAAALGRLGRPGWPRAAAAGALGGAVLAFNFAGSAWPGTPPRQRWAAFKAADERLLARLRRGQAGVVAGSYWIVYPVGFLSQEQILGLPLEAGHDQQHVADRLPRRPLRWALIDHEPERLRRWAACAELPGRAEVVDDRYSIFWPRQNPPVEPPRAFRGRLEGPFRATARPDPLRLAPRTYPEQGLALWRGLDHLSESVATSERWADGWFPGGQEITLLIRDAWPGDLRLKLSPWVEPGRGPQRLEVATRSGKNREFRLDAGGPQWITVPLSRQDLDLCPGEDTGWARLQARAQAWVPLESSPPIEDCRRLGVILSEVAVGDKTLYRR